MVRRHGAAVRRRGGAEDVQDVADDGCVGFVGDLTREEGDELPGERRDDGAGRRVGISEFGDEGSRPMTPASLRWASDLAVIASLAHSASMTVSVVFSLAPLTSGGMRRESRARNVRGAIVERLRTTSVTFRSTSGVARKESFESSASRSEVPMYR